MTRVVLDTNVLASGFTNAAGPAGQLLIAWLHGQFDLIISEHIHIISRDSRHLLSLRA